MLTHRFANTSDCELLAKMNHELIRDEGHRNCMTLAELHERMRGWLKGEYRAVIFDEHGQIAAYALYREQSDGVHLRQFYVVRELRRRGLGRAAIEILRAEVWPKHQRLTVEALIANEAGIAFWRSLGYSDYSLTLEIAPVSHLAASLPPD